MRCIKILFVNESQCKPNPSTPYFIFVNGMFGIVATR